MGELVNDIDGLPLSRIVSACEANDKCHVFFSGGRLFTLRDLSQKNKVSAPSSSRSTDPDLGEHLAKLRYDLQCLLGQS